MEPIIETIYLDSRLSGVCAQVEVTCCNHTHKVSTGDYGDADKWTCPHCEQTIQFIFGEVTYKIL